MGGHPYFYFVPYQADLQSALDKLRAREFAAGRYNPVIMFPRFAEPAFSKQKPGAEHESIAEAIEAASEDGTRSILDVATIARRADFGVAAPLSPTRLLALYGTTRPTRAMLEELEFIGEVDRGKCVYVVAFADGAPSEILFAGYSYD